MKRAIVWRTLTCISATLVLLPVSKVTAQTAAASAGQAAARAFRLEDGTPLKLRLQRTISSADAQVDERVDFDVLEEVKVGDVVVIPKGSVAWATVTEAQPKRRMGRSGKLAVNIDAVRLADGEKAPLRGVRDVKGSGSTGAMTAGIVATSLIAWPAAPLFLMMHGKDITIKKGTEITAYINGDINLDPAKFGLKQASEVQPSPAATTTPPPPSVQPPALASVASENLATVVVKSTPDGADVTVNGKFVGSTPSTLRLVAGDHAILIEKSGFKSWQRTMSVSPGGIVTIDATLDKQ